MEFVVDWLSFTVPYDHGADVLGTLPTEVVPLDRGFRGYTHSAIIGGGAGRVAWSPERRDMGYHFDLPASALRHLAACDPPMRDWVLFVGLIQEVYNGHFTRFDAAWDDKTELLDLDVIEDAVKRGLFTSRWGDVGFESSQKKDADRWGRTIYFGSRKSETRLRIYDKAVEQGEEGHWIRTEIQFRGDRADAAAAEFAALGDDKGKVSSRFAGILRGYLEFKEAPSTDQTKTRWKPAGWWLTFLGYAEKAQLTVQEGLAQTIEGIQEWISDQVSPSLALLEKALGFDKAWGWLYDQAERGKSRLSPRHNAILASLPI